MSEMDSTRSPVSSAINARETATTRTRYDRLARDYDRMQWAMEQRLMPLRAELWRYLRGPQVLEIGVGTGKNMAYYPPSCTITAVDLSPRMLEQARAQAKRLGVAVTLREADAQALPFPVASFDSVVTTCVFCSVPDPVLGLSEVRRVLKPGGQLLMLEHVRSRMPVLRELMDVLNPLVVRMVGANINRETVETIRRTGFTGLQASDKLLDILKLITAYAPCDGQMGRWVGMEGSSRDAMSDSATSA